MELVKSRTAPKTGLPTEGLFILVGHPKSGKTTLAASFPDSYVLELEEGGGDRVNGRIHDIDNLNDFRLALAAAISEPSIKTVVIDSIDVMSDWLEDEIAKQHGLDTISQRKEGVNSFAVWDDFKKRIEGMVDYFKKSGKLIILIAHCRAPKTDDNGAVVTPAGINVPGKAGGFLAAQADMIGFSYKKALGSGTAFFLTFRGGPLGMWGSRVAELENQVLTLDRKNPYAAFAAVFAKGKGNANGGKPAANKLVSKKKSKAKK